MNVLTMSNVPNRTQIATRPCLLHVRGQNRLLTLLPPPSRERVLPRMERVLLKQRTVLQSAGEPVSHVYFPLDCVLSLVLGMEDGAIVEVGTVGNEGMGGVALRLGSRESGQSMMMQIGGYALRMPAAAFRDEIARNDSFSDLTLRYAEAYLSQVTQSTACNRLHPLDQRLCRWILFTHDRVGLDRLALTQDFIAMMLGVRRGTVSIAAGMLQKAGLIRYNRGLIEVMDRAGLESACCECYAVVRDKLERLLC